MSIEIKKIEMNNIEELYTMAPVLSRSTQQYCEHCYYTSPVYGTRICPKCKTEFNKKWWSFKKHD